jgi:hypothetical protein
MLEATATSSSMSPIAVRNGLIPPFIKGVPQTAVSARHSYGDLRLAHLILRQFNAYSSPGFFEPLLFAFVTFSVLL